MKKIFFILITGLLCMGSIVHSQVRYLHQTTAANIDRHITTVSYAGIRNDPSALLFVTQQFGKYNTHQVGVWHNGQDWTIYNEDRTALVENTYFGILQVPAAANAYVHVATTANISNNSTFLDNAYCNNNPNAIILVTQNFKSVYNTSAIGVWYSNGRWAIFNQDLKAMPANAAFNVWIVNAGTVNGFAFDVTASKHIVSNSTKNNNPANHISSLGNSSQNSMVLITQNWGSGGPYNNHHPGVWWDGAKWTVFNQDRITLPDNSGFNIITITAKPEVLPASTTIDPNAYYRLTSMFTGDSKSLDIVNDGKNNHPWLDKTGSYSGQFWKLTLQENGYYRLTTQWLGESKSLDVVNDGKNDQPEMNNSNPYSGQYWKLTPLPGGYYRLTSMFTGELKSLDVINDGKNNQVKLTNTADVSGQYWKLTKL